MKQYKIFKNPLDQMDAVKQGWSWPAFWFAPFWALFKKMWVLGIGTIVGWFGFVFIIDAIFGNDMNVGNGFMVVSLVFGLYGNRWRAGNLKYRGYDEMTTVVGSDPDSAIATYLKKD
jgi:hypothetical protein